MELTKESSLLTTFITPFGRYQFNRLPFGITSAPEHFQRRMHEVMQGLEGAVCLIDDILIYGKTQEEHDKRLTEVLHKIAAAGITLNRDFSKSSQISWSGRRQQRHPPRPRKCCCSETNECSY